MEIRQSWRLSYLHNGNPYTDMTSLYSINPQSLLIKRYPQNYPFLSTKLLNTQPRPWWAHDGRPHCGGTCLTKCLWAHNLSLVQIHVAITWKNHDPTRSQFCICHDSRVVMIYANFWPDWTIRIIIKTRRIFTIFKYDLINPWWNGQRSPYLLSN